jgi:hypothetical protein
VVGGGGPSGPVQLLDFDGAGATFQRNNGFAANGEASARGSAATFADYATNALRTETLAGVGRYLFERERSSLVLRSDDWSTAWTKSNVTTTAGFAGPKGDTTATEAVWTSSAVAQLVQTIAAASTANNDIVTVGLWARGDSGGEQLRFGVRKRDAAYDFATITLTTEWAWYTRTVDIGVGASNTQWALFNSNPGVAKTIYIQRASKVAERYVSSPRLIVGSLLPRYADSLLFAPDEVPLALRESAWAVNVRPTWATADLATGEKRVICSTDANNWVGFEEDAGSVYLRCYTGGTLRFGTGALTIVRDTDYEVIVDLAGGQMTFGGVAGSVGTAATLPGGVTLRWGGTAGGNDELDAGTSEPFTVA